MKILIGRHDEQRVRKFSLKWMAKVPIYQSIFASAFLSGEWLSKWENDIAIEVENKSEEQRNNRS